MRSYVIETQKLFVPALVAFLEKAGLKVEKTASQVDLRDLLTEQPQLVFIDLDFLDGEPLETISIVRMLLPTAVICAYTTVKGGVTWPKACHYAGANAVFSKSAQEDEVVAGLRTAIETGSFTDSRLLERGDR
ncbi:MAG: response regulator [Vulcanimicrobiaceae bacterium]|jgi:DNA-binding NarL/FixJ family response regulator